jgi:integrase
LHWGVQLATSQPDSTPSENYAMTIRELFEEEYQPIRLMGKKNTIRLYRSLLNRLEEFNHGVEPTTEFFQDRKVAKFLSWRSERVAVHTVDKEKNQVCALWRYCFIHKIDSVDALPDIKPMALPQRTPVAWTVEELQSILASASRLNLRYAGSTCGVPLDVYFPLLIETLWVTAERVGAVVATDRSDLRGEYLTVRAENRKGGQVERGYRLPIALADRLHDLPMNQKLFAWDRNKFQIWAWMKRIIKRSGVPCYNRCSFHQIRRSAASHYVAAGGSATELLGHADPRVAAKHYIDPRIAYAERPAAYELLPSIQ